jgi:hypothetical protein
MTVVDAVGGVLMDRMMWKKSSRSGCAVGACRLIFIYFALRTVVQAKTA